MIKMSRKFFLSYFCIFVLQGSSHQKTLTFIISFARFTYCSPKTSISSYQSCPQRSISQVLGPAVMERSGDLSLPRVYFLFYGFRGTVSSDVKARLQPPLHHGRHLNLFPLLVFFTAFTAAQVFNTDQSLLLSPSFITTYFLLFFSFLLILFSFTCTVTWLHSMFSYFILQCLFLSPKAKKSIYLCLRFSITSFSLLLFLFPHSPFFPRLPPFSSFVEGLSAAGCW